MRESVWSTAPCERVEGFTSLRFLLRNHRSFPSRPALRNPSTNPHGQPLLSAQPKRSLKNKRDHSTAMPTQHEDLLLSVSVLGNSRKVMPRTWTLMLNSSSHRSGTRLLPSVPAASSTSTSSTWSTRLQSRLRWKRCRFRRVGTADEVRSSRQDITDSFM